MSFKWACIFWSKEMKICYAIPSLLLAVFLTSCGSKKNETGEKKDTPIENIDGANNSVNKNLKEPSFFNLKQDKINCKKSHRVKVRATEPSNPAIKTFDREKNESAWDFSSLSFTFNTDPYNSSFGYETISQKDEKFSSGCKFIEDIFSEAFGEYEKVQTMYQFELKNFLKIEEPSSFEDYNVDLNSDDDESKYFEAKELEGRFDLIFYEPLDYNKGKLVKTQSVASKIVCEKPHTYEIYLMDPSYERFDPDFCKADEKDNIKCLSFITGKPGDRCSFLIEDKTLEDFDGNKIRFSLSGSIVRVDEKSFELKTSGTEIIDVIPAK